MVDQTKIAEAEARIKRWISKKPKHIEWREGFIFEGFRYCFELGVGLYKRPFLICVILDLSTDRVAGRCTIRGKSLLSCSEIANRIRLPIEVLEKHAENIMNMVTLNALAGTRQTYKGESDDMII